jgi:hypothetical protein
MSQWAIRRESKQMHGSPYARARAAARYESPGELPAELFTAHRSEQLLALAALLDEAGWIHEQGGRWRVGFTHTRRALVEQTAALMQRLGIHVGPIKATPRGYRSAFTLVPGLRSLLSAGAYFNDALKQTRLLAASTTLHAAPPKG